MVKRQDLHIRQGETFSWSFIHRDSAGTAVDVSAYSARMKIKWEFDTAYEAYLHSDSSLGTEGTITLEADGTVTISMTAAQSRSVLGNTTYLLGSDDPPNNMIEKLVYDLELVTADGVTVTRALEGHAYVQREATD